MANPPPPSDAKPPSNPGQDADDMAQLLQAQLEALLSGFDLPQADALPKAPAAQPLKPAAKPPATVDFDELAAALEAESQVPAEPAPTPAPLAAPVQTPPSSAEAAAQNAIDQQIDALLASIDQPPAPAANPTPAPPPAPKPQAQPTLDGPPAMAMMPNDKAAPTDAGADASAEPQAMSLEDEIAALFAQQPVDPEIEQVASKFAAQDQESAELEQALYARPAAEEASEEASTEDLIAAEIEGLLNGETSDPAADEIEFETSTRDAADPSISEIDQLLATEAEQNEELVGDFQSVDDITAGIVPNGPGQKLSEVVPSEADAGSASSIAAELDNQPENKPDTFSRKSAAERATDEAALTDQLRRRLAGIPWRTLAHRAERTALWVCGLINWPARRLLAPEWRSYVGYIAVLNVFVGLALFALGVARQVF